VKSQALLFGFFYFWSMDINAKEIVVSEGKKPLWKIIIAAFLFTVSLFIFIYYFYLLFDLGSKIQIKIIKGISSNISLSVYAFLGAISLSKVKTIYIDLENEKLRTEHSVGIFKVNYFSVIPELEYVSVFLNPQNGIFEVNLWYKGNRHYNVFNFEEFKPAFNFGLLFSNKLNIDLLDATEKGNFKWIDKSKL
jgi:hypothetical protein